MVDDGHPRRVDPPFEQAFSWRTGSDFALIVSLFEQFFTGGPVPTSPKRLLAFFEQLFNGWKLRTRSQAALLISRSSDDDVSGGASDGDAGENEASKAAVDDGARSAPRLAIFRTRPPAREAGELPARKSRASVVAPMRMGADVAAQDVGAIGGGEQRQGKAAHRDDEDAFPGDAGREARRLSCSRALMMGPPTTRPRVKSVAT